MLPRDHRPTDRSRRLAIAEADLRAAARTLETLAVIEPEFGRVATWAYRLAQRLAVDSGRLEWPR